jgi:hypothetical protein
MKMDDVVARRLEDLVRRGAHLVSTYNATRNKPYAECRAWIAAASNLIRVLCPVETVTYHIEAKAVAESEGSYDYQVETLMHLLQYLSQDIDAGLLRSIEDRAVGQTYDDFLEHAAAYHAQRRHFEAGVIAGATFEDTVRRICRKHGITDKGENLEDLISALVKQGIFSATKAKRARVGAHVRTKATHAQPDEFDLSDVGSTIDIARELISQHLD